MIHSENVEGTRGHTADIGRKASWDIRYNQLVGLGRTQRVKLDDTVLGQHIGTNQRGKYAEHKHHVQSAPGSADVGNVYIGPPAGKWGLVIHQTSDTLVERNVAVDFPGAGFITEDGYEVRNTFRNNPGRIQPRTQRDASERFHRRWRGRRPRMPGMRRHRLLVARRHEYVRRKRSVEQLHVWDQHVQPGAASRQISELALAPIRIRR